MGKYFQATVSPTIRFVLKTFEHKNMSNKHSEAMGSFYSKEEYYLSFFLYAKANNRNTEGTLEMYSCQ